MPLNTPSPLSLWSAPRRKVELPIFSHEFSAKNTSLFYCICVLYVLYFILFIFRMPQLDAEVQIPRPVVPNPAPGNDAPEPPVAQQARELTAEEKLEVNVWVVSTRIIRMVFIVFFLFLFLGGCFLFIFSWSSLVCDVFVILHVAGLCNVIMYRRLSLGASGVCLLVLSSMSFGVSCCYFPRSWVFALYIRIILYCL